MYDCQHFQNGSRLVADAITRGVKYFFEVLLSKQKSAEKTSKEYIVKVYGCQIFMENGHLIMKSRAVPLRTRVFTANADGQAAANKV